MPARRVASSAQSPPYPAPTSGGGGNARRRWQPAQPHRTLQRHVLVTSPESGPRRPASPGGQHIRRGRERAAPHAVHGRYAGTPDRLLPAVPGRAHHPRLTPGASASGGGDEDRDEGNVGGNHHGAGQAGEAMAGVGQGQYGEGHGGVPGGGQGG